MCSSGIRLKLVSPAKLFGADLAQARCATNGFVRGKLMYYRPIELVPVAQHYLVASLADQLIAANFHFPEIFCQTPKYLPAATVLSPDISTTIWLLPSKYAISPEDPTTIASGVPDISMKGSLNHWVS